MKNRALFLVGRKRFEIRTESLSVQLAADEVLLRIRACSLCGSDLTYAATCEHTPERAHVLGHEFVGEVVEAGAAISTLSPGDRVVADAGVSCGGCPRCISGHPNLCPFTHFYGYPSWNGGFQEYMVFPARACLPIPPHLDDETAVLAEPLAVCLHALSLGHVSFGDTAAVIGAGSIGLMLVWLLRRSGATVYVVEPDPARRAAALRLGAALAVDPAHAQVVVSSVSLGVDRVFEAAGKHEAIRLTTSLARAGARVVLLGIPPDEDFAISHTEARKRGLTILMVRRLCRTLQRAIDLLAGDTSLRSLITHRFDLMEAPRMFELGYSHEEGFIKGVVRFGAP
jgi:L-iditol 2-dehydrogenase